MANNDQNDKELNDYLNGDSDMSKAYRASNAAEPASRLDDAILSAAKEAVERIEQKKKPVVNKPRWLVPVSIAAMVTLSVSLVVTMQQEVGQPLISEPEVEMFDSAPILEESVMLETTVSSDDASVMNGLKLKQNKDERVDVPAATALGAAADMYQVEEKEEAAKARMKAAPAKKMLLKEKAQLETLERRNATEEQVFPSVPTGVEFDDVMSMKQDDGLSTQEDMLLKIKALWKQGELVKAKEAYEGFTKNHPDVSSESIKEILGDYIYNELLND